MLANWFPRFMFLFAFLFSKRYGKDWWKKVSLPFKGWGKEQRREGKKFSNMLLSNIQYPATDVSGTATRKKRPFLMFTSFPLPPSDSGERCTGCKSFSGAANLTLLKSFRTRPWLHASRRRQTVGRIVRGKLTATRYPFLRYSKTASH